MPLSYWPAILAPKSLSGWTVILQPLFLPSFRPIIPISDLEYCYKKRCSYPEGRERNRHREIFFRLFWPNLGTHRDRQKGGYIHSCLGWFWMQTEKGNATTLADNRRHYRLRLHHHPDTHSAFLLKTAICLLSINKSWNETRPSVGYPTEGRFV